MLSRDQRSLVPDEGDRDVPGSTGSNTVDFRGPDEPGVVREYPGPVDPGLRHDTSHVAPRVARIELPVGRLDPMSWLREQRPGSKSYWSGRGDGIEVAAVGAADLHEGSAVEAPQDLEETSGAATLFGGPASALLRGPALRRWEGDRSPGGRLSGPTGSCCRGSS